MVKEKVERRMKAAAKQYAARAAAYVDEAKEDILESMDDDGVQARTAAIAYALTAVLTDTVSEVARQSKGRSAEMEHGAQMARLWLKMLNDGVGDCVRNLQEDGKVFLLCEMTVAWVSADSLAENEKVFELQEASEGPFGLLTRSAATERFANRSE